MTKQESSAILVREDRGPVEILTLNRPDKLNALSNELIAGIMNALNSIELRLVRSVVVIRELDERSVLEPTSRRFRITGKLDQREAVMHFMAPWPAVARRAEAFDDGFIAAVNAIEFGNR